MEFGNWAERKGVIVSDLNDGGMCVDYHEIDGIKRYYLVASSHSKKATQLITAAPDMYRLLKRLRNWSKKDLHNLNEVLASQEQLQQIIDENEKLLKQIESE